MNKKLICLTLSILMLLSCLLTGCSSSNTDEDDTEATVDNSAKTITMWVIAADVEVVPQELDDGTMETMEQAEARTQREQEQAQAYVNQKFSEITKSKFKTNVVLRFCSEEEYYEKLEAAVAGLQADIETEAEAGKLLKQYLKAMEKNGKTKAENTEDFFNNNPQYAKYKDNYVSNKDEDEETGETEEETITNIYGITEIKYPDAEENQVDIFYIGDATDGKGNTVSGYDKYMEYYNAEWLASLSEELSTSSKKLTDYISTSLLSGVQVEGSVYAIPNNVPIGEYTYMFIDKALFDKYYHKISKVETVLDLNTFLGDVMNENLEAGKTVDDDGYIVPLASTYAECAKMLCWYWDLSYTDRSVYETYYDEEKDRNYVLKTEYEVQIEVEGSDGSTSFKTQKVLTNMVVGDQLYKTNANGQYLDADGHVLDYHYEVDSEGYFLSNSKGGKYVAATDGNGMYLVDGDGNTVTPENDKRVILTKEDGVETNMDDYGNHLPTYVYSYNDSADFSILGAMKLNPAKRTRGGINLGFESLFTKNSGVNNYHTLYSTLMDYGYRGYYGVPTESQTAAVSFVKGDAKILQDYNQAMEDLEKGVNTDGYVVDGRAYYVVVAEYPQATEEELYGNMYAVYENSANLSRCMKVITYLNTNKEMRDLLQYGVEDIHYELNDDGTVHLLSGNSEYGTYRMDIERTGNCFIATPEESMGADAWKYAKMQNNDSLIDPLLGFDFNSAIEDGDTLDILLIDHIKELNEQALEKIAECTSKEELLELMTDTESGLMKIYASSAGDVKLNKATNNAYDPSQPLGPDAPDAAPDTDGSSPYTVYQNWLKSYGYLAAD